PGLLNALDDARRVAAEGAGGQQQRQGGQGECLHGRGSFPSASARRLLAAGRRAPFNPTGPQRRSPDNQLSGSAGLLAPGEYEINGPAAPNVRPRPPEVREDVPVLTTGVLQGIGQHGKPGTVQQAGGEEPMTAGRLCEAPHGRRPPGGGKGDGAEGVAED